LVEPPGYKLRPVKAVLWTSRTPAAISSPLGSRRIAAKECAEAKRGVDRGGLRSKRPYCSWGPCEPSSSAGLCGARVSAHPHLTSGGCLNAAAAGRAVSSARLAKSEQRRAVGPRPTGERGRLSFGSFSLANQSSQSGGLLTSRSEVRQTPKGTALSGAHPDAASRSENRRDKAKQWIPASAWMTAARTHSHTPCPNPKATQHRLI